MTCGDWPVSDFYATYSKYVKYPTGKCGPPISDSVTSALFIPPRLCATAFKPLNLIYHLHHLHFHNLL